MIELHPQILEKDAQKQWVVLPYEEWLVVQELLADAEDLLALREAKRDEQDAPALSLQAVKERLSL